MSRVSLAFTRARREGRAAFMPFLVAGDPSLASTAAFLAAYEAAGADVIEIGFPYSDPLADGPVIQRANQRSLAAKTTVAEIFDAVRAFREKSSVALVAMAAASLLERCGPSVFAKRAAEAGFDALLVPDLPIEAVSSFFPEGPPAIPLVHLVAPTTPAARAARIGKASRDFVYVVALTGVTGSARGPESERELEGTIARVRAGAPRKPVAVGFGVSTPADARAVARVADGVIVGSALVTAGERRDPEALRSAAASFASAIRDAAPA